MREVSLPNSTSDRFSPRLARVLKFLYEKRISHMDLKPENILLTAVDKPQLKVADFGVAQHIGRQGSRSIRGTLLYMAPEILSSHPYDNRVYLWSIGVILYGSFDTPTASACDTRPSFRMSFRSTPFRLCNG